MAEPLVAVALAVEVAMEFLALLEHEEAEEAQSASVWVSLIAKPQLVLEKKSAMAVALIQVEW